MHSEAAAAAAAAESQTNRARSSAAHGQQGAASAVVASDGTLLAPSLTSDGASMSESWLTRLEVSCRGLGLLCPCGVDLGLSVRVWVVIEQACRARAGRQQHLGPAAAAAAAGGSSSLDLAAAAVREDGAGPAVRSLSAGGRANIRPSLYDHLAWRVSG
eukprot:COSAG01_NODE_1067_length_11878_cov_89.529077_4_plen_159_part_00